MSAQKAFELYRCTDHGGSKDWAIMLTPHGLTTLHCATGQTVRKTDIPPARFSGSAMDEISRRVREKLDKGYKCVGKAVVDSNRFKLVTSSVTPPIEQGEHWSIVRPLDRTVVREKLEWAAEQLRGHGVPELIDYDADAVVLRTSNITSDGTHVWTLGFCDEGGILQTGRGGGQILAKHGLLPRLIMLYFVRCFPNLIQLTDSEGNIRSPCVSRTDGFIGQHLFDFERVLALGKTLGLCIGRISLLSASDDEDKRPFWI